MRFFFSFMAIIIGLGLSAQEPTEEYIKKLVQKPTNLKAEIIVKDNDQFIHLTWGEQPHDTIAGLEYLIYASAFSETLAQQASLDIRKNSYDHPAPNRFGKKYKFQVEAIYEKQYVFERSPLSDTLEIYVPTKALPEIYNLYGSREGNTITLSWKYSDQIDDLLGFELYDDGRVIASEKEIPATSRSYSVKLDVPGSYRFQVRALTRYGVKSKLSRPRTYTKEED